MTKIKNYSKLVGMKNIKALVIDMDGVLWHGETPVAGLSSFFDTLNELSIPCILATNNATKVATDYTQKLAKFGVSLAPENILTSSEATASYLRQEHPELTEIYVMGEAGLKQALKAQGFSFLSPEDVKQGATTPVVVGALIRESLSYELLAMGCLLIRKGSSFIATNYDSSFPSELGFLPGAGAMLSVLEISTGVKPTVVGKPNSIMFQEALKRLGIKANETAMVGDRLNTDIEGGRNAGMQTILVLSGVSTQEDATQAEHKPDFILKDINDLAQQLKQNKIT